MSKPLDYAKNKAAFDAVFNRVRDFNEWAPVSATNHNGGGESSPKSSAAPRIQDFLCDVSLVVRKVVPQRHRTRFRIAYECIEWDDAIMQERWADRTCGGVRHSWEQRVGAELIRRGIHPYTRYFHHERLNEVRQTTSTETQAKFYSRHRGILDRTEQPWQFWHGRGQQPLVTLADIAQAQAAA